MVVPFGYIWRTYTNDHGCVLCGRSCPVLGDGRDSHVCPVHRSDVIVDSLRDADDQLEAADTRIRDLEKHLRGLLGQFPEDVVCLNPECGRFGLYQPRTSACVFEELSEHSHGVPGFAVKCPECEQGLESGVALRSALTYASYIPEILRRFRSAFEQCNKEVWAAGCASHTALWEEWTSAGSTDVSEILADVLGRVLPPLEARLRLEFEEFHSKAEALARNLDIKKQSEEEEAKRIQARLRAEHDAVVPEKLAQLGVLDLLMLLGQFGGDPWFGVRLGKFFLSESEVIAALGATGDKRAVDALKERLRSGETAIRIAAVEALGGIGDRSVEGTLIEALGDASPDLREAARRVLDEWEALDHRRD